MSACLVNGKLITDKYDIRDMCADHFEELGTPDLQTDYDNNFAAPVSAHVANFCKTCLDHPVGVLNEPLSYFKRLQKFVQVENRASPVSPWIMSTFVLLGLPFGTFYMNYTANFF